MNKIILYLALIIFLSSCANWGGDNPVGITGGSDNGYGMNATLDSTGQIPQKMLLIGSWRHDYWGEEYIILIFSANGVYREEYHYYNDFTTINGTYTTDGNQIVIVYEYQYPRTFTFSIEGNLLILTTTYNEPTAYYRI